MAVYLLTLLSKDYQNLFESGEFADVTIQVGEKPNTKVFRAHSLVLRTRSTYFRAEISKYATNSFDHDNINIIFNHPNASLKNFEVILRLVINNNIVIVVNH